MLPDGWDLCRLEDLATVERGKFSARPRNDPKFFGGNIPFVQTGDVTNSSIYVRNYSQTLNEEGLSVSKMFPKGTILMTIAANIGDTAIASFDLACPDSLVGIIAKKNKADVYWLRIFLGTQKTTLENYAPQNAQKNINLQTLKPLEILTPPLPEQKKIAAILSTWDRAIEGTEKLLANSQQQKKALMQQLLTGKKRLPGFTGEWKTVTIGSLLKEVKRPVEWEDDNFYKLLSVKRRSEGVILREVLHGTKILTKKMNYARSGDFLISKMQVVHGASGLVPEHLDNHHISDSYIALRAKNPEKFDIEFFSWLSKERVMYYKTFLCSYGVTIEKMTFNFNMYLKENIKIPPTVTEQRSISQLLNTTENEITALESDLSRLRQEKKALMQQLLTGKIRVAV